MEVGLLCGMWSYREYRIVSSRERIKERLENRL